MDKTQWVECTLGDVLRVRHGRSQKFIENINGKFPILASGGEIGRTDIPLYTKPSVLIGRKGTIDRPQFMNTPFWTIDTLFYTEIFPNADPKFLYYFFLTVDWRSMNEASGVPSLSSAVIEKVPITLPSLDEQQRISSTLDQFDRNIENIEKLISKKKDIKQGLMQELLSGKKRLSGFNCQWEKKELRHLLGYEQPGKYLVSSTEYRDNGIPVLTAGKTFILGFTDETHGVYDGDPVIIFDDFTTDSKYVDFPFKAKSSAMKLLHPVEGVNLRWIFEKMQTIKFNAVDHKRRWIAEYRHIMIDVPPAREQQAIADVLDTVDVEVRALESQLEKAKLIKQGMMQKLLTGQTRLT